MADGKAKSKIGRRRVLATPYGRELADRYLAALRELGSDFGAEAATGLGARSVLDWRRRAEAKVAEAYDIESSSVDQQACERFLEEHGDDDHVNFLRKWIAAKSAHKAEMLGIQSGVVRDTDHRAWFPAYKHFMAVTHGIVERNGHEITGTDGGPVKHEVTIDAVSVSAAIQAGEAEDGDQ